MSPVVKTAEGSERNLCVRRRLEAEVERLRRLFTEEKALRKKEVARVRRTAKKEFAKKVGAIEAKIEQYRKVSERYMFLVQARANAELIADLEGGKRVEEEKDEVLQWKEEDLKLPLASPDFVNDSFENRSIEGVVVGVGVTDQEGSNLGPEAFFFFFSSLLSLELAFFVKLVPGWLYPKHEYFKYFRIFLVFEVSFLVRDVPFGILSSYSFETS